MAVPSVGMPIVNSVADSPTEQNLVHLMTKRSRGVLQRMEPLSDCTVETSDGVVFHLHKSVLAEPSGVLRDMILDLSTECCFKISNDSKQFALIIDALYCGSSKHPPINEETVETIGEMARNFDMPELAGHCDTYIAKLDLTLDSLPRWHAVAAELQYNDSLVHCRKFISEGGNFEALTRQYDGSLGWLLKGVPADMSIVVLEARLKHVTDACQAYAQALKSADDAHTRTATTAPEFSRLTNKEMRYYGGRSTLPQNNDNTDHDYLESRTMRRLNRFLLGQLSSYNVPKPDCKQQYFV